MIPHKVKTQGNGEGGISLLIVMLVGTIMLMTSVAVGQYAIRMSRSLQTRSDAIQALYTAEQTVQCVKYWINIDTQHFTNNAPSDITCNGYTFDFRNGSDSAIGDGVDPEYDPGTGLGSFRIPTTDNPNGPGVFVEVVRTNPAQLLFDGYIRVYSQSGALGSSKNSERFLEYHYRRLYGADVMFVVDRSGSIEDRSPRVIEGEWDTMLNAIIDSINLLLDAVPAPQIGIVSFGEDAYDTGELVDDMGEYAANGVVYAPPYNWRTPDVRLTTAEGDLINAAQNEPRMRLDVSYTNLSLGLSIAGAELMRKYYPHSGEGDPRGLGIQQGFGSGDFEDIIANNLNFNSLPNQSAGEVRDREDTEFPDVIVVITDGAPNGIMSHVTEVWDHGIDTGDNPPRFINVTPHSYVPGEVKLFRTFLNGTGDHVVDDRSVIIPGEDVGAARTEYNTCDDEDRNNNEPTDNLSTPDAVNEAPYVAMCNSTRIAKKLENDGGIKIIAIYVTDNLNECPTPRPAVPPLLSPEARWLYNDFVSETDDGKKLYAAVCDYGAVESAIMELFERMSLIKSR